MSRVEFAVSSEASEVSVILEGNDEHHGHFLSFFVRDLCLFESHSEAISGCGNSLNINKSWFLFISGFNLSGGHVLQSLSSNGILPIFDPPFRHLGSLENAVSAGEGSHLVEEIF